MAALRNCCTVSAPQSSAYGTPWRPLDTPGVDTDMCLWALLLCCFVERESRTLGYQGSLSSLLDLLNSIRLALILLCVYVQWGLKAPIHRHLCVFDGYFRKSR